jgi:hypothetical protein
MEAGVAGRADSDQQIGGVPARAAVMHCALIRCPADAAGMSVTCEDEVAVAAEAGAGVKELAITGAAKAGDGRKTGSTRAEQRALWTARGRPRHKG